MPVKIRLARRGRKKKPFYHIVIADVRAPRDGRFIEKIGTYNPMTVPATIELDRDRAFEWLEKGAQPTHTVRAILKFKGVYYKRHLMRGVKKGALTEEKAQSMLQSWIDQKEEKIAARFEQTRKEKEEFWKMVSGEIKPKKAVASAEAAEPFRESGDDQEKASPEAQVAEEAPTVAPATAEAATEEKATPPVEQVAEVAEEKPAAPVSSGEEAADASGDASGEEE